MRVSLCYNRGKGGDFLQTKYPILLVHGVAIKNMLGVKAFGKIDRILKSQGYHVHIAEQDGFGTIENNAGQLKEQIEKILSRENAEKINLIAHSKGGLDCKYLIKELGMEDKVASLTTLCTPHKGSPIASSLLKLPSFALKFIAFWINFWYRIFGDKHPDALAVCRQLQRVEELETETLNVSDKVYCQSFSTRMDHPKDDFILGIPLLFSRLVERSETDGLVPLDSTLFGFYRGDCTDGSVSHQQIVDFMASKKKKDKIYAFYGALCEDLAKLGF